MEWKSRCRDIVNDAVSREGVLSLLNVIVNNLHLSSWNLLFVYEQNTAARHVCGRRAWERRGKRIREDAEEIRLLLPKVALADGKYSLTYLWVKAYGEDDTEGQGTQELERKLVFADVITRRIEATWEFISEEDLQETLGKGRYDAGQNTFYLSRSCPKEQLPRMELELYVDYVLLQEGMADQLLKLGVCYILFEHFQMKHTVVGALFTRLSKFSAEEKMDFFLTLHRFAVRILADLEGEALDWDEVALVNDLMVSEDKGRIRGILDKAGNGLAGEDLTGKIARLGDKLGNVTPEFMRWLYDQRKARRLYSYPPIFLDMEREDYFRAEGSVYEGKQGCISGN